MAWHSQDGVQRTQWQGGYPPPASFPVAARQRPCDSQEYAYSRASYTNYDYVKTVQPPAIPTPYHAPYPPHISVAPTREADFRAWAAQRVEHANRVALWAEQCEAGLIQQFGDSTHQHVAGRPPHTAPCLPEAQATSPATAGAPRAPRHASNGGEEAARQFMPAAAPPPRPARSIARSILPPSTRLRASTKTGDARLEDREARAASSATTWPASTPARPPSPPARSTARSKVSLPREDALVDALSRTTSAKATSAGDPGRTSPTNDRLVSSSTPTATPTRPIPPTTVSTLPQVLPPRPSRLYGPRAHPTDPNLGKKTNKADVLQDIAYLRAIVNYAEEGGEKEERTRKDEGADALARSVRGTLNPQPQTTDRDFSRDCDPSRAIAPSKPTFRTSPTRKECGGRERGQPVAAEPPAPTLHTHAIREIASATLGLADHRDVTAACPATCPSPQSTGLALSGGMGIPNTRRATARVDNGNTNIPSPPRLARSALKPALPSPPACPYPLASQPAPSTHRALTAPLCPSSVETRLPPTRPTRSKARNQEITTSQTTRSEASAIDNVTLTHCGTSPNTSLPFVRVTPASPDARISPNACAEVVVRRATTKKHEEYTRADDIRLARAPVASLARTVAGGLEGEEEGRLHRVQSTVHRAGHEVGRDMGSSSMIARISRANAGMEPCLSDLTTGPWFNQLISFN
ncbi:hypothetical protein GGF50DRAFT_121611 [Schizophyllum commune]